MKPLQEAEHRLLPVLREAKALVFDFDGTLVDSDPIKWRAFEKIFSGFPDHLEEILRYCRSGSHTPRWEKFRYVYEQILNVPYTPELDQALAIRFNEETIGPIIHAPEISGAERFLAQIAPRVETGALSSTPQEALLDILKGRGWLFHFKWVRGAPVNKSLFIGELRKSRRLASHEILFFGDTLEDSQAAKEAECIFIAVGNRWRVKEETLWIRNFSELIP